MVGFDLTDIGERGGVFKVEKPEPETVRICYLQILIKPKQR